MMGPGRINHLKYYMASQKRVRKARVCPTVRDMVAGLPVVAPLGFHNYRADHVPSSIADLLRCMLRMLRVRGTVPESSRRSVFIFGIKSSVCNPSLNGAVHLVYFALVT